MLPYKHKADLAGLLIAFKANTLENDIIAGQLKPVGIFHVFFKFCVKFSFYIKDPTALDASCVIMLAAAMVITVSTVRHFYFTHFARFGQKVQIPVNRRSADMGVFLYNRMENRVSGNMTM